MAFSSPANANQVEENITFSHFRKTVTLRDWWLVKPDDDESEGKKKLAVEGFTCGEIQAKRVFKSAAISKRWDIFTLETVDGIIVILQGFINKIRTTDNGFPSEVFRHFVLGFPPNWEDFADNSVKEAVTTGVDSKDTSDLDEPTNNSYLRVNRSVANLISSKFVASNSENQNEGNEDGLNCGNTSTLMETRSPETLLGCMIEEVVAPNEHLSKLVGDYSKLPSNYSENTMKSSTKGTDGEVDNVTPSIVKSKRASNARLSTSRVSKQSSVCFENNMESSPKKTDGEVHDFTPSKVKSKRASNARLSNSRNAASRKIKEDLKDNQKQKDVAELPVNHKNKKSPKVVQHLDKKGPKKCSNSTLDGESSIQQRMIKASRVLRSLSDSGKSKENAEDKSVKGGSSTRKAKRRIVFYTPVGSPHTQKSTEKTCIASPDSFKRSRSGRLLLPALEFWRNQVPIYDGGRNVTGVREELSSSAGSKSEPKKQKKRR